MLGTQGAEDCGCRVVWRKAGMGGMEGWMEGWMDEGSEEAGREDLGSTSWC